MQFYLMRSFGFIAGAAIIALVGCANQRRSDGFQSVQQATASRVGSVVQWNTSSVDDARADRAVDRLLDQPLTADTAEQVALLGNASLQADFENVGIAQADLVQAGLLKNPMFDAAYEFAAGGGKGKINLSVTEDFLSLLAIPLRKKMAASTLNASKDRVGDAVMKTATDARRAFYEYQAAAQLHELRDTAMKSARAAADVARHLHDAGNLSELDLATHDAEAGTAMLADSNAEADVTDKRELLNEAMGLSGTRADRWTAANRLPDAPATQPTVKNDDGFDGRFDLLAARHEVEAEAQGLGIARQFALLPDASAGASAEREHDGTWETGPSIAVPIPLFNTGNAQVAAMAARWRQAKRQYQAMAVQARAEIRRAMNHVTVAAASVKYLHDTELPLRDRIVSQTLLQYNGMYVSVFQLIAARSAEVEAGRSYVEALRDYWVARVELERATDGVK